MRFGVHRQVRLLLFVSVTLSVAPGVLAQTEKGQPGWHQFRGANVDGVASANGLLSSRSGVRLQETWRSPIGSGYSGVSLSGNVAVTMFSDGKSNVTAAFDTDSGREHWRFELEPESLGIDGSFNGPISTPLIYRGVVIALGTGGRLVGLDLKTGRPLWSTDLVKDHGALRPHYGFSTSPIVYDEKVLLLTGIPDGAVASIHPQSGKFLWTAGSDSVAYQTPTPILVNGKSRLLAIGDKKAMGIDVDTGQVSWEQEYGDGHPRGSQSAVPVAAGNGLVLLKDTAFSSSVYSITESDGVTLARELWESRSLRNTYAPPVYYDGYIYGYSSRFLTCVDVATGKSVWKSRPPGDGFTILIDDHVGILTKQGELHLIKATPDGYQPTIQAKIFDKLAWTPPSFHQGSFYLRGLEEMVRVDLLPGREMLVEDRGNTTTRSSGVVASFLEQVATASDKSAAVDRFLGDQSAFPIIEAPDTVHFVYRGPGSDVALAGDLVGARQEVAMNRVDGTDLHYYSATLEPDARINYLFIVDYEQVIDPRNPRETSTAILGADMEIASDGSEMKISWMAMPAWKEPGHLAGPVSGPQGRLVDATLESALLKKDIRLEVYLPQGYDSGDDRYPVAYVHEAFGATSRGNLKSSMDHLVGSSVEPVVVVLIYEPAFAAPEEYSRMWRDELVGFIDKTYRTRRNSRDRANIGHAFGSYAAVYCTFRFPGVVDKLAVQSIFWLDTDEIPLKKLIEKAPRRGLSIYMDWGRYDLFNPEEAWDLRITSRKFMEYLEAHGYSIEGGLVNDSTGWSSWKNRTDKVFQTLYPAEPN